MDASGALSAIGRFFLKLLDQVVIVLELVVVGDELVLLQARVVDLDAVLCRHAQRLADLVEDLVDEVGALVGVQAPSVLGPDQQRADNLVFHIMHVELADVHRLLVLVLHIGVEDRDLLRVGRAGTAAQLQVHGGGSFY
jgi:hypothetical protein